MLASEQPSAEARHSARSLLRTQTAGSKSRALLATAGLAAAGVALLARLSAMGRTSGFDKTVRARIQRRRNKLGDGAARAVSVAGYPVVHLPGALLFASWLRDQGRSGGQAVITASLSSWTTHRLLKLVVRRQRPTARANSRENQQSFPSGHTTSATAVALTAAWVLMRQNVLPTSKALPLAVGLSSGIGVSRIYNDEHWASDVIGAWISGIAVAAVSVTLFERQF
jgi:membrane-associated phospholipid phosphatase